LLMSSRSTGSPFFNKNRLRGAPSGPLPRTL
jgi:hypothetical protein